MRNLLRYGGIAASIVLIAFGIGAIVTGVNGRDQVRSDLAQEQIVGTPDSTIPGQKVDTGSEAHAFAKIMRHHTMEATGGQTYSQMGQFIDNNGKPTNDKAKAAIDPKTKQPVANQARQIWVTETALTTALNTAYFAEQVATFAIVMGIALLLSGIGFLILALRALGPIPARKESRTKADQADQADEARWPPPRSPAHPTATAARPQGRAAIVVPHGSGCVGRRAAHAPPVSADDQGQAPLGVHGRPAGVRDAHGEPEAATLVRVAPLEAPVAAQPEAAWQVPGADSPVVGRGAEVGVQPGVVAAAGVRVRQPGGADRQRRGDGQAAGGGQPGGRAGDRGERRAVAVGREQELLDAAGLV